MDSQSSQPRAATFWLSPDGDDGGPGARDAPFLTIAHAHSQVLRFAESAPPGSAVTLMIEDGTYELAEPLRFDPERFGPDGPAVRYRADSEPVISGGRRIGGWTLHDAGRNIYTASVQGLRARLETA